ncbi:hypothetical protein [Mesobacillus harenae]|uniref:hypothetical protein n=1 Tax=Mesobacillus harenae TaxID=2213203 RepID=UPI0015812C8A|nr:hypothetical protein [Mesobacillus harenae]
MKFLRNFLLGLLLISILSACEQEPLKFRNLLEADQYIRNNVPSMEWNEFKQILGNEDTVTVDEFQYLKEELSSKYSTSYIVVENKLYRFRKNQNLMYMTEWEEVDNLLYLKEISYIPNN